MIKIKVLNAIEAIILSVATLILLFSPLQLYTLDSFPGVMRFTELYSALPSLGIITLGLVICNIIMCLLSIFKKTNEKDSLLHGFLPIISLISVWIFINIGSMNVHDSFVNIDYVKTPSASILYVLIFISSIIGFAKRSNHFVNPTEKFD